MNLPPYEPECRPWRIVAAAQLWSVLGAGRPAADGRPRLVAVDGRSGSGKSTLAGRLAAAAQGPVAIVHTDDIAWHHSFFDWDRMLAEEILTPARNGQSVRFVPPAWRARGREGAIVVADCSVLLVEGVGAFRHSLAPFYDAGVYVQADLRVARRRLADRDGDTAEARAFIAEWEREEVPFLATERPWARADVVLAGSAPAGLARLPGPPDLVAGIPASPGA